MRNICLFNKLLILYLIIIISLGIILFTSQNLILIYFLIALSLIIIALYFYGVFIPDSNLFITNLKGKDLLKSKQEVIFRFDDGPHPVYTPILLDILKKQSIQAIFSVTGENCDKFPELLGQIADDNHIICNHSYSHSYFISLFSNNKLYEDLKKCNDSIERITGQKPKYYCPPMGHKSLSLIKVLKKLNLKVLNWDVWTKDTTSTKDQITNHIQNNLREKSIILFHDGIYPWTNPSRQNTIDSLLEIISWLDEKNIPFQTTNNTFESTRKYA